MDNIELKTRTVKECWEIARDEAQFYQDLANRAARVGNFKDYDFWIMKRDVADRIALMIKNGVDYHD